MNLLIKFPDQSQSFTFGVEYGRLLERIQRGDDPITNDKFPVRAENLELLKSTCSQYGYAAIFGEPYLDGWVDFIGIKKTSSQN